MKIASRILSLIALVALATAYVGCGSDGGGDQNPQQVQFGKLSSTWNLTTAKEDGTARQDFTNVKITLSGTFANDGTYNYSLSGTLPNPSPWPKTGTWKFGSNPNEDIIRDPGTVNEVAMKYTVTDSNLVVSFNVPEGNDGWEGGRATSVSGDWQFEFSK